MTASRTDHAFAPDAVMQRLFTIYLPLSTRDGRPVPAERLLWARDRIAGFAQGCTVLSPSDGMWVSQCGQVHHDSVLPIQVVAPATADSDRFFAALAGDLAALLGQDEIFIHVASVTRVEAQRCQPGETTARFDAINGSAAG